MARKYDLISELYDRTCKTVVSSPQNWEAFLTSACRNYKLRFDEQLLVFAQRPDATAVLEIERWNGTFGRWVNRGATGIAVFDDASRSRQRLIHYFDISDTHPSKYSRPVPIWEMKPEYEQEITETLESMKRQAGRPSKENSVPVAQNYEGKTSRELLGEQVGESQDQVRRYIRLTNLVPELLDLVDEGKIKMRPAVELSYLDEDSQRAVVDEIDLNQCTPSHDQTIRMRKFFTDGKLTPEVVSAIMSEEKPNQREKIVLRGDKVRSLIPKNIPVSQTEDYVVKALEHYSRFLRQRAERDSR